MDLKLNSLNENAHFFLIAPLGLEDVVESELKEKAHLLELELKEITTHPGGVAFSCEAGQGVKLNSYMRSAVRCLLRIKQKKVTDFPKLYQTLLGIPWNRLLSDKEVKVIASSKKSRLINTSRIEDTTLKALSDFKKKSPFKKPLNQVAQNIYLRFEEDLLTISYDLTGEKLYLRSQKVNNLAPLRENIAYCLLRLLLKEARGEVEVIDPMAGSGTFLLEALAYNDWIDKKFSYQNAPFFRGVHYKKVKASSKFCIKKSYALDLKTAHLPSRDDITVKQHNVFDPYIPETQKPRYLICNPPYGIRMGLPKPASDFYEDLHESLKKYQSFRAVFIAPLKYQLRYQEVKRFFLGGIWLGLYEVK